MAEGLGIETGVRPGGRGPGLGSGTPLTRGGEVRIEVRLLSADLPFVVGLVVLDVGEWVGIAA